MPYVVGEPLEPARGNPQGPPTELAAVPGIEGRHSWQASTGAPVTTLNYLWSDPGARRRPLPLGLSARPGQVAVGAVARLERISGLHSRSDTDDNRGNRTGRVGEYLLPSMLRGRTITYEGQVQAGSLNALREAVSIMRQAFAPAEGTMWIDYNQQYDVSGPLVWSYFGRITQFEVVDEQPAGPGVAYPHSRNFVLAVRQGDPRYVRVNLADIPGAGLYQAGPGDVIGSNFVLNYPGTAPADPTFIFATPGPNITLTNETAGWVMHVDGLPLDVQAAYMTIDFGRRIAWGGDFESYDLTGYVNLSNTNAWDSGKYGLVPGPNTLYAVTATGSWNVNYHPTYW